MNKLKSILTPAVLFRLALIALTAVFVYLLAYGFPDSPSPWFDEGINMGIAKSLVQKGVYSLQIGPERFIDEPSLLITTNYPLLIFVAAVFRIFGSGLWQVKVIMSIFLALFVFLSYQFVRKNYGKYYALMSYALLIFFLPLYGNGKSGLGEVPGLTYFLGGLFLINGKKGWRLFFAGLLFGLAAVTKSMYLLLIAAVAVGEIYLAIKDRKSDYRRWLVLCAGAALPLLIWAYTLLPRQVSNDYLAKTFQLYSNPYQASDTFLQNLFRFVSESTPIHFALLLIIVMIAKIRSRRPLLEAEAILLVFIALNIIFYLRTVGWYRYFFPAHILLLLLFPAALFDAIESVKRDGRLKIYLPVLIFSLLLAAQAGTLWMNIQSSLYYNPVPRNFSEMADRSIGVNDNVLVVEMPEIAFLLHGNRIWQRIHTNPHVVPDIDILKTNPYPEYIISQQWEEDEYLKTYLSLRSRYDLASEIGRYHLYRLQK